MTYKKRLIIAIVLIVLFSIVLNSLISRRFIDKYFERYIEQQYQKEIEEVILYSKSILNGDVKNLIQVKIELSNYLEDMIESISVYDANDKNIISVDQTNLTHHDNMMGKLNLVEEKYYEIIDNEKFVGYLVVERIKNVTDSGSALLFRLSLIRTVVTSGFVTLIIAIIFISIFSKKMTKDLTNISLMAEKIDTGEKYKFGKSKVKEIKIIQNSLINLSTKLKLKEEVRKERVDKLAHEAKTPLTILKSNIEGSLDGLVEVDKERLQMWLSEVNRLSNMFENIGDIVEYKEIKIDVSKREFSVNEFVNKISKAMLLQFEKKNIDFNVILLDEDVSIYSDENLLAKSIYNLLSNACKYSRDNSSVQLITEIENDNVVIKVIDQGIGIGIDDLENIFNAYYRGNNHDINDGQGMGLYIVKQNIEALGGEVKVKVNENTGMSFWLTLKINA